MKQEIEEDTAINIQEQMSLEGWSATKMPPQTGRLAVVTGATGGLGYETALGLAQGCADVIVAGRNEAKGRGAAAKIRSLAPKSLVRFEKLDLADLKSVSAFAARLAAAGRPVDLLINNAGVMALPSRGVTADGFEMQFGINHLGHFALTGHLLPLLRLSRAPRVVQVSSLAYRIGKIRFEDIHGELSYGPWESYAQSKLAGILFAGELQRRSDAQGWGLLSTAVHPGYARTDLVSNGPGARSAIALLNRSLGRIVSQSAADGAQPALFAASSPGAQPGGFYGPGGLFGITGAPVAAFVSNRGRDLDAAHKLWQVSEQMTGVEWPVD
jgi:NAD(P)-dependent dehydrogenase (short-subunit alcohol dehydrogenase family)